MIACHWFSRMIDRQSSQVQLDSLYSGRAARGAGSVGVVERWPSVNKAIAVNIGGMTTTAQLHTALNAAFGFPDFYGGNFPALVDCWSSLRYPDDAMSEVVLDSLEDSIELRVAGADSCSEDVLQTLLAAVTAVNHRAQLNGLDDVILLELTKSH